MAAETPIDTLADHLSVPDDDDVYFKSVKEMSRYDPPLNCPMRFRAENGAWVRIEPGDWSRADWTTGEIDIEAEDGAMVNVRVMDPDTRLPVNFPVQPLGIKGKRAYFMSTLGEVIEMKGSDGKGEYELLFAGRNDYLFWAFPRRAKPKKDEVGKPPVVGWEADQARQMLIKACGHLPTFSGLEDIRGRGMWRDEMDRPVLHCGDAILYDGKWRRPGRYGGHIYPALPAMGRPKNHYGLSNTVGAKLHTALCTWGWERPVLDPRLQLGWIMVAKLGGAIPQRPTLWLTAEKGAGKTYLQKMLRSIMNSGLVAASNTTAAAVYQRVRQDCVPILLDEMEAKDDSRKIEAIIELFRISYSGDRLDRGGQDGEAKTYILYSACLASSIAKPSMGSQDDSRMAHLTLRPIEEKREPPYTMDEAYKWGQVMTQRALDWLPRWDRLVKMFDSAMRTRKGHSDRSVETFAPLAAGYHAAMYNDLPDKAQLEEWAGLLDPAELVEVVSQMPTWQQCIGQMLGQTPEIWKNNKKTPNLGLIIRDYMRHGALVDVSERLRGSRLAVKVPKPWTGKAGSQYEAWLFIPNTDPILNDIFAGTAWAGSPGVSGPWNGVLRQAPPHLWRNDTSTKGGVGNQRGISFHIAELLSELGHNPMNIRDEDAEDMADGGGGDNGEAFGG